MNLILVSFWVLSACIAVGVIHRKPVIFIVFYIVAAFVLSAELPPLVLGNSDSSPDITIGTLHLRLLDAVNIPLIVTVCINLLRGSSLRRLKGGYTIGFVLLVLYLIAKCIVPSDTGLIAAFGEMRDLFSPIFLILYVVIYLDPKSFRRAMSLIAMMAPLSIGVISLFNIIRIGGVRFDSAGRDRFIGAGTSLILAFAAFYLLLVAGGRRERRSYFVALSFALFGIVGMSNHRSVWLATAAGLGTFGILLALSWIPVRNISYWYVALLTTSALFCGIIVLCLSSVGNQGSITGVATLDERLGAFTNSRNDANASWRMKLWEERLRELGSNWFFGRPMGARVAVEIGGQERMEGDHNAYVSMFETGGAVLLSLYALGLSLAIRQSRIWIRVRDDNQQRMRALVIVGLVASHVYFVAYDLHPMGMLMVGALFCIVKPAVRQAPIGKREIAANPT